MALLGAVRLIFNKKAKVHLSVGIKAEVTETLAATFPLARSLVDSCKRVSASPSVSPQGRKTSQQHQRGSR